MAILQNFNVDDLKGLTDFKHLALGTNNATDNIITANLQTADPAAALEFQRAVTNWECAMLMKRQFADANGRTTTGLNQLLVDEYKKYELLQKKHAGNPGLEFLFNPISRKQFDVKPYKITAEGKHHPPQPYPGMNAAMDGIWPGYDKPEYLEQFPFLQKYEQEAPGKTIQAFLRAHNLFFHFPETVSRYGVLFVPPPYLSDNLNVELRQHLSKCDALFHTAPTLSSDTTVAEAKLVLSYVEDDMVVVVTDRGGTCVGVLGWEDLHKYPNLNDESSIGEIYQRGVLHEAPTGEFTPQQAFEYMEKKEWPYMLRFTEQGPRIVTQTTASISHFLPPHTFKKGLGSAVYLGISNTDQGDNLVNRLNSEADGFPAAIVETAHADTPYFRKILRHYRDKMRDIFLMAGTTVDEKAVIEFLLQYEADCVKLGIAEGTACRTSNTGVALPNAHVGLVCGSAAMDLGYLALDGWGDFAEFNVSLAMNGIQMRQGGGAFMGRREAANPSLIHNGSQGKWYRGMAGADVQMSVLGVWHPDPLKRMEAKAQLHSEGAEMFVKRRSPSTVGRMLLAQKFLLMSAMSYAGVRSEIPEEVLRQFQHLSKMYDVRRIAS